MSQSTTVSCDKCAIAAEKPTAGSPAGWMQIYGGRPYRSLDFCSWECLQRYVLESLPQAQAVVPLR